MAPSDKDDPGQDDGPWGSRPSNKKPQENPSPWQTPWSLAGKEDRQGAPKDKPRAARREGGAPEGPSANVDFQKLFDRLNGFFERNKPKDSGQAARWGLGVLAALWLLSGVHQVATDQLGVVLRFGGYNRTEQPGLRYRLPAPFEEVLLPVVTSQNEIQIGFRRTGRGEGDLRPVPQESMMLSQDENLISVEFTVFWRISDVAKYLFEIRDPEMTIKMAAESAMREVIGQNKLQFALTDGRSQIAEESRQRLQDLMDEYNLGVSISQINLQTVSVPDEVKAAFQDVINARLDQERFQNQAAAHVNKVLPDAKGQAAQIIQQAMAYRDQKIAVAKGDAERFKEVLAAYNVSKDVTAKRLYLETMEDVLARAQKVIMEKGTGTMPYLPLKGLDLKATDKGSDKP